jgi:hypothetical protein
LVFEVPIFVFEVKKYYMAEFHSNLYEFYRNVRG